ncbi:MAG TPA: terminase family protein [Gaiellaceae bacterium]|jgi:hypothetical protein
MRASVPPPSLSSGLVAACDDPDLFGVELTPRQRELLEQVEAGDLLHVWALGRRSGKTLLGALIALWFSLLRPELGEHVRRRERRYAVCAATNLRQARIFVDQARSIVEASPLLAGLVKSSTDDEIVFSNRTVLAAFPCTSRGGRGWPIACLLLDEAAHMLDTDGNQAAEPVYRSLVPSTAQFGEAARVIVASSPFGVDGFFADLYGKAEAGELTGAVAAHASTMDARPALSMAALDIERQRDPEGFRSEYGAEFVAAGGAFLDGARIAAAATRRRELRPGKVVDAIAAVDLGFVSDSTALAIVGRDLTDRKRLRLVLARGWKPDGWPLGFGPTLDAIADVCLAQGVRRLYTDQHHATAAVEHLARRGVHATIVPTSASSKSQMFADLKTRLYGGELELYDEPELLAELRRIETVTTPGAATVRIRRLGSSHGDLATALALACWKIRGAGGGFKTSVPRGSIFDRRRGAQIGEMPPTVTSDGGRASRIQSTRPARRIAQTSARRDSIDELAAQLGIPVYDSTRERL